MATKLGKDAKAAFEIANLLDDAADAIRKRSKRAYAAGRMSLEEYMEARARELELRSEVSVIVATDLSAPLDKASEAEKASNRLSWMPRGGSRLSSRSRTG